MSSTTKFCRDCKHFSQPKNRGWFSEKPEPVCLRKKFTYSDIYDRVTGELIQKGYTTYLSCDFERRTFGIDRCGYDGKYFEARE